MPRKGHLPGGEGRRDWSQAGRQRSVSTYRFGAHFARWVQTHRNRIVQIVNKPVEGFEEDGPEVVLFFPTRRGTHFALSLSDLTEEELLAVRSIIIDTCDMALPIVRLRDANAQRRLDEGDDTNPRVYRPVPEQVTRPWALGLNSESILERFATLPERDPDDSIGRVLRGSGSMVSHLPKADVVPDYNTSPDGEPEELREDDDELGGAQ